MVTSRDKSKILCAKFIHVYVLWLREINECVTLRDEKSAIRNFVIICPVQISYIFALGRGGGRARIFAVQWFNIDK